MNASPHDELDFNTTPNYLTLLRMILTPGVIWMMFEQTQGWDLAAALLFAAASITDFVDGYIARSRNIITVYGKLMDPLADKFLVVSVLILLEHFGRIHPVLVILLVCRELAITGLRALASAEGVILAAETSGKIKTILQMVAIPLLVAKEPLLGVIPIFPIGQVLIYASLLLSLGSAGKYMVEFFQGLREHRRLKKLQANTRKSPRRRLRGR